MPTLELLIDATGMQRGAQAAKAALDDVTRTAEKTSATVKTAGASLSGAFQVGSGGIQIASGIAQTAKAFGDLNTAAGLFSASRTILEIGNTARDFQQFRTSVGGAATAFGALGAVIRANPIGAIATAIGLAATAMSLFSESSRRALTDYRSLVDEVLRNDFRSIVDRQLGVFDPRADAQRQQDTLRKAIEGINRGDSITSFGQLQQITNLPQSQLLGILSDVGNAQANQLRGGAGSFTIFGGANGQFSPRQSSNVSEIPLTDSQALAVLKSEFDRFRGISGSPGVVDGRSDNDRFLAAQAGAAAEERLRKYNESLVEQAQRLEAAAQAAEQFGQTIGGALFDAISGANTLRGALASAFQSIARQGFQTGVSGIFGAAVRGLTQAQQQSNAGIPQVGGSGITTTPGGG